MDNMISTYVLHDVKYVDVAYAQLMDFMEKNKLIALSNFYNEVRDVGNRKYLIIKIAVGEKMKCSVDMLEWKKLYVLKRLTLFISLVALWFVALKYVQNIITDLVMGFRIFFDDIVFGAFLFIVICLLFFLYRKDSSERYKCVPIVSKYLSRKCLRKIILKESFEYISSLKGSKFSTKFLASENWLLLNGRLFPINLIGMMAWSDETVGKGQSAIVYYYLEVTFVNGESCKIKVAEMSLIERAKRTEINTKKGFERAFLDSLYDITGVNGVKGVEAEKTRYLKVKEHITRLAERENVVINEQSIYQENSMKDLIARDVIKLVKKNAFWISTMN